jgi:hypothetical protein
MDERRRNTCLVLLGLVPGVMALVAEAIPARMVSRSEAAVNPSLSFRQFGVSYPEVPAIPVIGAQFDFVNRGRVPLTIEKLEPSCGCLRVQTAKKVRTYAPGETGSILVHLNTANERPGPHHYSIDVVAVGEQTQREQLTFRLVLPERKVSIEPSEVYFYQLTGQSETRTVYLVDHRENPPAPLDVTAVTPVSSTLSATVLPAEQDAQGRRRIPIELSVPAEVAPGAEETFVRIETSDTEFSQLKFPVLIQGPPEVYGPPIDFHALGDVFAVLDSRQARMEGSEPH